MSAATYTPYTPDVSRRTVPPSNPDAELAVLSAMLLDNRAILAALEIVDADAFYVERHRVIFAAIVRLMEFGRAVDPVTLASELDARGELQLAGGRDYLYVTLSDGVPTAANVADHARLVRDAADRRRLIDRLGAASAELWTGAISVREIAADLQSSLLALASESGASGFVHVKQDLWPMLEEIEARARNPELSAAHVVPTGYPEIDRAIGGGLELGDFMVIAGVPGGCKTAAAMNIALNAAIPFGATAPKGALVVSAEMKRRKLHMRNLAALGPVDFKRLKEARLVDNDWPRLARASGVLSSAPIWVDETPTPAIEDVIAKCRKEKAEHPEIALIVVDFIQLVQKRLNDDRRMRDANRALELTSIAYAIKGLAKELDVAAIATCQVDAADIEKRADRRPRPGDARWSQGMREAADLWASAYRPKMYDPDPSANDTLELLFQKARDAELFTAVLQWHGHHMLLTSQKQSEQGGR